MKEQLSVSMVGQMTMDLFYKNYKASTDFFELEHFIFCNRAVFGKLIETEADKTRQLSKAETGYFSIDLSQDWLVTEKVSVKKIGRWDVGVLSQMPFPFPFDKMSYAVQTIESGDNKCSGKDFVRISPDDLWTLTHLPKTQKVFFHVLRDEIRLANSLCIPSEIEVDYAPSLTGDPDTTYFPLGKQMDVITMSVQIMKNITDNKIIDKTIDQNPNTIIQNEVQNATV